ncbi:type II methionyl aminopeptidase [archaeon SCG-AAA382B04]|nr:type II methionyl aminopeptidase [archaeon SCG-AAA382B04]
MKQKEIEKYKQAGKILREVRKESKDYIEEGQKLIEIAKFIEDKIKQGGAKPAFPVNISLNEIAAHYTPKKDDQTKVEKDDILTIDMGVHIDGYIADSAYTLDFGDNKELIQASKKAVEKAIQKVEEKGAGISITEISQTIEYQIKKRGFNPIANLTGHGLKKYETHSEPSIPNVKTPNSEKLHENQIVAIEPFATDGSGRVKEGSNPQIFSLKQTKQRGVRDRNARKILKKIKKEYKTLPFAKRWLTQFKKLNFSLKKLQQKNILRSYSPLKDRENGLVSQAEETIIVKENSCEKTT